MANLNQRIASLLLTVASPAFAQAAPTIVSLSPAHGTADLDPAETRQLVVTFDQDMDPTLHAVGGAGVSMPSIENASWRDPRTYVMQVHLERDHVYALELSGAGTPGFASQKGARLLPTSWHLATIGDAVDGDVVATVASRLFTNIRERYAYGDRLGVDWAQLERANADRIGKVKSGGGLALLIADVLSMAQDPQITVRWNECVVPTYAREAVANFDPRGLQRLLPELSPIGRSGMSARTADGIGYLKLNTFDREHARDFEQVLQVLRGMLDCKGIILDVRSNGGGDEHLARRLAAFFVDGDKVYAATRERTPEGNDGFADPQPQHVRGNGSPDTFARPVAVLMGRLNMGACETFLLMLKQAPQVRLIGDNSYGCAGSPGALPLMPNLGVTMRTAQVLRTEGTVFEGEGIAPHIHVQADKAQLDAGDPVLQEALLRLRN